jgi:hypothetical protein
LILFDDMDRGSQRGQKLVKPLLVCDANRKGIEELTQVIRAERFKRLSGTVGLSSVAMFGAGGGWGIPIAPPTLMITVGSIVTKPRGLRGRIS